MSTVLVARLDSDGDVLLSGPAVRAASASADRLVLLCSPSGAGAARLLPGVDEVVVWSCPWVVADPGPVDPADVADVVARLRSLEIDRAFVLTSFHQSPLPTALVLRLAGIGWVGATSVDYPGSLLDLRHQLPEEGMHEVERMLALLEAAGCPLPVGDDGRLRVLAPPVVDAGEGPFVVVHPGASVPARAPSPEHARAVVAALVDAGHRVAVTGGPGETALTAAVAAGLALDLGGKLSLAELSGVLAQAGAVVVGNTGPAHLAAAVGTPVVSLFSPVVPRDRWRPWGVPQVLLGDQDQTCALTRARTCPVPGHPCLTGIAPSEVVAAVRQLTTKEPAEVEQSTRVKEVV